MASVRCKSCGHENIPGARFCANCGAVLAVVESPKPVVSPSSAEPEVAVEYMGFGIRFGAAIIDIVLIGIISVLFRLTPAGMFGLSVPVLWLLYNWLFTGLKGQTPGKMVVGIKVVDARGNKPGLGTAALREIPGKILSLVVPIFLGFLWIIWDERKQGWHDKIADTYVVRVK